MAASTKDARLKLALIVAILVSMVLVPRVFFYGIVGLLALGFSIGSLHYLIAAFRSTPPPAMSWGRTGSCPMSRFSRLLIAALLGTSAALIIIRGLVSAKRPDTHYLFFAIIGLLVLVLTVRWWETRNQR